MQGSDERTYKRWPIDPRTATDPPAEAERPVCTRSPLCEGCPFPGHGFLCWNDSGDCMKTRFDKIKEVRNE